MEIGSFIELEFPKGKEKYRGKKGVARLNTGRAAIYHASRILNCSIVYVPLYQCESVRDFLKRKGIVVKQYVQDSKYNPLVDKIEDDACILLVNYFGIMSHSRMSALSSQYKKVIIDNSQAFYAKPVSDCLNIYSARKFVGVPDGAYVVGKNAEMYSDDYEQGYSSDTSQFLLQRIEFGCEGKTYASRTINEERIDGEDIKKMSKLTQEILDGINYKRIADKRRENFDIAMTLFQSINEIDPCIYYDGDCVPMVYPLYYEDDDLLNRLLAGKHFQGHWWSYILNESTKGTFEYNMSRYMIPITIDQRYGEKELKYVRSLI